jgi:hypothetical protein
MMHRPPESRDRTHLATTDAERLLKRASELDVARRAGSAVDELRAAATEAGISPQAFDAALAEMRGRRGGPGLGPPTLPSLLGRWRIVGLVAFLIAVAAMILLQRQANSVAVEAISARTVEESVLLHCVTPDEAAEIVRPLLQNPWNTIVINPESSPGRVRIRGRTFELSRAKTELAKYDGDGSAACPVPPVPR